MGINKKRIVFNDKIIKIIKIRLLKQLKKQKENKVIWWIKS